MDFKIKVCDCPQHQFVAISSPLSPVIANVYMEDFEGRALDPLPQTPLLVLICGRPFRHLGTWSGQPEGLPEPPE
jgi:hypothetical protein